MPEIVETFPDPMNPGQLIEVVEEQPATKGNSDHRSDHDHRRHSDHKTK